jgi:hypothetical protein
MMDPDKQYACAGAPNAIIRRSAETRRQEEMQSLRQESGPKTPADILWSRTNFAQVFDPRTAIADQ